MSAPSAQPPSAPASPPSETGSGNQGVPCVPSMTQSSQLSQYSASMLLPFIKPTTLNPVYIAKDAKLHSILKETIGLSDEFIKRLGDCGIHTPQRVVNTFGDPDLRNVATAFATLGAEHVLNQASYESNDKLIMFCRSELFGPFFEPTNPGSWKQKFKRAKYNDVIEGWNLRKRNGPLEELNSVLENPGNRSNARNVMAQVRKKLRKWVRDGARSDAKSASTLTTKPNNQPQLNSIPETVTVHSPRLSESTALQDNTTLGPQTPLKQPPSARKSYTAIDDNATLVSDLSVHTKAIADLKKELASVQASLTAQQKKEKKKLRFDRRASFYHSKRASYEKPKSPFDAEWEFGCNDSIVGADESEDEEEQNQEPTMKRSRRIRKQWVNMCKENGVSAVQVCMDKNELKRAPLPPTVKWDGNGATIETYIDQVTGHVTQQPHMGYLLLDSFMSLWMQHGEPLTILQIALEKGLHHSLKNITPDQLLNDVTWLYGALKQSLPGRGRDCIHMHEHTQDGIITWLEFLDKYRFDGNVAVFLAEQQRIVNTEYTPSYRRGLLGYLEDVEAAFINIERVSKHKTLSGEYATPTLYTDSGKRSTFIQNTIDSSVNELIEQVESETTTWDAFVNVLRRRLARRMSHARNHSRSHARQAVVDVKPSNETVIQQTITSSSSKPSNPQHIVTKATQQEDLNEIIDVDHPHATVAVETFINVIHNKASPTQGDYNIGWKLWQAMSQELRDKVVEVRRQAREKAASGGNTPVNSSYSGKKPTSSIVKAPPSKNSSTLPMQYSSQNFTAGRVEEDVETFLQCVLQSTSNNAQAFTCHAHTNYYAMLSHVKEQICIPDGGADSHVGGMSWLPLTPTSGPLVKFANVIGFDSESARKSGLPIVAAITKVQTTDGTEIILRAKHLVYNGSSPHTLLSTFQMRETGAIVDDVSKRHHKDAVQKGTHSIRFPQGHVIELKHRAVLSTFESSLPTLEEYNTFPDDRIVDIALYDWNPQQYHEELIQQMPPLVLNSYSACNDIVSFNTYFSDPIEMFLDTEEEEFFDASEHLDNLGESLLIQQSVAQDSGELNGVYDVHPKTSKVSARSRALQALTASACFSMANASAHGSNESFEQANKLEEYNILPKEPYYFDAKDATLPQKPGRVMQLSLNFEASTCSPELLQGESIPTENVDEFLADIEYSALTGHNEIFNTLSCALSAVERIQRLENLQPKLAWKPLEVIKKTLENTTQWARTIAQYPMKKHHVSRFPWNNRRRLREEVAMDTIFMGTPGYDGSTCEQVFVGLVSRMINVYPMPSKAHGHIFKAYQDFMRYEGAPQGLHRDLAPEEKVDKILDLNREMMVKDTWAEAGHPNENPAEALGVKPLKTGAEQLMNRTGAPNAAWPWAHKYIADVNNHCSTPMLNWKTPISVRHGYTPDISAFLQFQFWERVYFKVDEQHPESKEAPGYWMGVSDTVGDALTYDIWSDDTKRVIQRSAVRSADPNRGGILNRRVNFEEDMDDDEQADIVEPSDIFQKTPYINPNKQMRDSQRTNKHKVKPRFHDAQEFPSEDDLESVKDDLSPQKECVEKDFSPKISTEDLPQSHYARRRRLNRNCKNNHLLTASALLSLTATHSLPIIDTGCNLVSLEDHPFQNPFDAQNTAHILETVVESIGNLSYEAFVRKMQLQYLDTLEDMADEDWSHIPISVLSHQVSFTPRKQIIQSDKYESPVVKLTKDRHIRVKTVWKSGETSWVAANALREQNPFVLVNYVKLNKLESHPDFKWTNEYIVNKSVIANTTVVSNVTKKQSTSPKYKFGVEIPKNGSHALYLDQIHNDNLWQEAINKELDSINEFETFRVLDEGEEIPEGYVKIPYHLIFDCKFDGRRKCRLVAGGHRTPDVPHEETYSGVVSMETIRTAFVLSAMNNLEVCAADISTAFLYGKTREKVYVIAGKEFGKHAGKRMIIDKGLYGLKSSSARFHEHLSARLRKMGFKPSKADFDLWLRPMGDHYEYVATYVDDILAFSRDPMKIIQDIQKDYMLKGIGKPEYYLGGNYHTTKDIDNVKEVGHDEKDKHLSTKWLKEGIKTAFSARTYIENCIGKLETMMNVQSFALYNSPMSEIEHPETDDSPLLDAETHSKFRSLVGSANWLVTLGRFDIAYAVNAYSRFSMAPRQGHLKGMIRVFGYLKKFPKGTIIIDPNYPDHAQFDVADYDHWREFYPDVEEMIPGKDERPSPKGPPVRITVYQDADHAHDILTRRSVTGVLLFLNNTPVKWISKRQKTVETSTYGSELVAAKIATELVMEYRYSLRMMGAEPDGPALMLGDNNSVVLNCTMPSSVLKKKHNACAYHRVREAIAGKILKFTHIPSEMNYADILTKPLPGPQFRELTRPLLFRVPME